MKRILAGLLALALFAGGCAPAFAQSVVTGVVRWTFAAVTLDGSSDTLRAAATNCASLLIVNPSGNAVIYVDISGGTAASTRGIPVAAGTWLSLIGQSTPCNAVTVIGTNTQVVQTWTGL